MGHPAYAKSQSYTQFTIELTKSSFNLGICENNLQAGDACQDGAFAGKNVLFGTFYDDNNGFKNYPCPQVFDDIRKKGFTLNVVSKVDEFNTQLPNHDIGIFTSDSSWKNGNQQQFITTCLAHTNQGKGLYIFGDNEPYYLHANLILNAIFGFKLMGNTMANKILKPHFTLQAGTFLPGHIITTGVPELYEGVTICYPSAPHPDVKVLGHSTDGNPVILYADKTGQGRGRVVIDCGFTKLGMSEWQKTVGTSRYVTNAVCWLSGVSAANANYCL